VQRAYGVDDEAAAVFDAVVPDVRQGSRAGVVDGAAGMDLRGAAREWGGVEQYSESAIGVSVDRAVAVLSTSSRQLTTDAEDGAISALEARDLGGGGLGPVRWQCDFVGALIGRGVRSRHRSRVENNTAARCNARSPSDRSEVTTSTACSHLRVCIHSTINPFHTETIGRAEGHGHEVRVKGCSRRRNIGRNEERQRTFRDRTGVIRSTWDQSTTDEQTPQEPQRGGISGSEGMRERLRLVDTRKPELGQLLPESTRCSLFTGVGDPPKPAASCLLRDYQPLILQIREPLRNSLARKRYFVLYLRRKDSWPLCEHDLEEQTFVRRVWLGAALRHDPSFYLGVQIHQGSEERTSENNPFCTEWLSDGGQLTEICDTHEAISAPTKNGVEACLEHARHLVGSRHSMTRDGTRDGGRDQNPTGSRHDSIAHSVCHDCTELEQLHRAPTPIEARGDASRAAHAHRRLTGHTTAIALIDATTSITIVGPEAIDRLEGQR